MKVHHHRHPKVHRFQSPKQVKTETKIKYKFIEDLWNREAGKEIWVLGSGPSLDDFPDGFFDWDPESEKGKIAIAVKYTHVAWPKAKYYQWSMINRYLWAYFLKNQHLLEKCIINLRSRGPGASKIGNKPIYMPIGNRNAKYKDYEIVAPYLVAGKRPPNRYPATATIVHWALQVAAIMGASRITAVGCEAKFRKFQAHALKRGMDKVYGPDPSKIWGGLRQQPPPGGYSVALVTGEAPRMKIMRQGTDWLAKAMKPYGIEIARYYYGKGYEEIT